MNPGLCAGWWNLLTCYVHILTWLIRFIEFFIDFTSSDINGVLILDRRLGLDKVLWLACSQRKVFLICTRCQIIWLRRVLATQHTNAHGCPSAATGILLHVNFISTKLNKSLIVTSTCTTTGRFVCFSLWKLVRSHILVQSLVTSWLDYCNSLLAGAPMFTNNPLQFIQKAAANLFFEIILNTE